MEKQSLIFTGPWPAGAVAPATPPPLGGPDNDNNSNDNNARNAMDVESENGSAGEGEKCKGVYPHG